MTDIRVLITLSFPHGLSGNPETSSLHAISRDSGQKHAGTTKPVGFLLIIRRNDIKK